MNSNEKSHRNSLNEGISGARTYDKHSMRIAMLDGQQDVSRVSLSIVNIGLLGILSLHCGWLFSVEVSVKGVHIYVW